jgi:hypothetical protein
MENGNFTQGSLSGSATSRIRQPWAERLQSRWDCRANEPVKCELMITLGREEVRPAVPDGTLMLSAVIPSHEWLGYFRIDVVLVSIPSRHAKTKRSKTKTKRRSAECFQREHLRAVAASQRLA